MKTAYCMLNLSSLGVITFSDALLARIEELKKIVRESEQGLRAGDRWSEMISVQLTYGGMRTEEKDGILNIVPSADGPVLVYRHNNYPNMRRVDDYVRIIIGSDDAFVESDWEEGSDNPLGFDRKMPSGFFGDHTIGSIPDIHFSQGFLRHWCDHLFKLRLSSFVEVSEVVEDMPPDHRKALDESAKEYLKYHERRLIERKKMEQVILREACNRYVADTHTKLPKGTPLRIGLDFHGVIDDDPEYFSNLSTSTIRNGGEVHVLTGTKDSDGLRKRLEELGIAYTNVFSISSHHESIGTKVWEDDRGPWMDADVWNRSKAEYCKEHGIQIHFDDSGEYGKHFDPGTVYIKYPDMETTNK
jgi:hypothetical protein